MSGARSRALARIDSVIAAARSAGEAACLKAQRVALLGQLGQFDAASVAMTELRALHQQNTSMELAAWVCLAEGIVEHKRNLPSVGRDRIRRAHAIAAAARLRPLIAISSAWLAQIACASGDAATCAKHLAESLQEAAPLHHAARSLASLVAAEAYHGCARLDLAQPWYEKARQHALAEGDDATISALMTSRACIEASELRLASIFGSKQAQADEATVRRALMAIESSANFDAYVNSLSRRPAAEAVRAQLGVMLDDFGGALTALSQHLPQLEKDARDDLVPALLADMAWCRLKLGRAEDALMDARRSENGLKTDCSERARAAVHGRLAQVFRALNLKAEAKSHEGRAQAALAHVRDQRARTVELLDAALRQVSIR